MITNNILYFVNFEKQCCVILLLVIFFLVHFQSAIMKDRHNMLNDLTLYHTMTNCTDTEEEAF